MYIDIMPKHLLFLLIVAALFASHCQVKGQSNNVSPKLDFNDTDDKSNTSVPIIPGTTAGRDRDKDRTRGNFNGNADQDGHDGGHTSGGTHDHGRGDGNRGGDGKSGPKIHGVRVTVDTGDTNNSKESKESVEISEMGGNKNKKRVGIHTDITFEITADGDEDANATSSAQRTDKEDASVPIFKGRGGSSSSKPHKPYDGKSYWSPSLSSERRAYDGNYNRGAGGTNYGDYYPQYPYNVPVYTSGAAQRRSDGWTSYTPSTYWTTERPHYENYRPNQVSATRTPTWKPCYCISTYMDGRRRRETGHQGHKATKNTVHGKLESPFSSK